VLESAKTEENWHLTSEWLLSGYHGISKTAKIGKMFLEV